MKKTVFAAIVAVLSIVSCTRGNDSVTETLTTASSAKQSKPTPTTSTNVSTRAAEVGTPIVVIPPK